MTSLMDGEIKPNYISKAEEWKEKNEEFDGIRLLHYTGLRQPIS